MGVTGQLVAMHRTVTARVSVASRTAAIKVSWSLHAAQSPRVGYVWWLFVTRRSMWLMAVAVRIRSEAGSMSTTGLYVSSALPVARKPSFARLYGHG